MVTYTRALDEYIARLLKAQGSVTVDEVSGYDAEDAAFLLGKYAALRPGEPLLFDGRTLSRPPSLEEGVGAGYGAPPASAGMTPLAEPQESYAKALWLLPVLFGLLGGLIAWALTRERHGSAAKRMLIAGAGIQIIGVVLGLVVGSGVALTGLSGGQASTWPPSGSGRPVFYYFGTSG